MKGIVLLMIVGPLLGVSPLVLAAATGGQPDHPTWAQKQATATEILLQGKEAFNDGDYGKARLLVRQAIRMGLGAAEGADASELNHEITRRWRAQIAHRKSGVTAQDLLPSGSSDESLERRQRLFGLYSVQDVDGHEGRVGSWVYGWQEAEDYYRGSGCEQAAVLAHDSLELRHEAMSWQVWSMIGGAAVGAIGGAVYANTNGNGDPYTSGAIGVLGVVGGLAGGALVGGVMNYHCRSVSDDRFREAADTFNQSLKSRLKLSVLPLKDGAIGQLSMAY
jgi:hypothetical protein